MKSSESATRFKCCLRKHQPKSANSNGKKRLASDLLSAAQKTDIYQEYFLDKSNPIHFQAHCIALPYKK